MASLTLRKFFKLKFFLKNKICDNNKIINKPTDAKTTRYDH